MRTNVEKGAGLHAEPLEVPFFECFPLSPPTLLPKPEESSGKVLEQEDLPPRVGQALLLSNYCLLPQLS